MVVTWFGTLLNLDHPGHMRVQRTKILVVARCREREREAVVGIQRFRPEFAGRDDGVRNVVTVLPGDGRAGLHRELYRLKGEIVDVHHCVLGADSAGLQYRGHSDGDAKPSNAKPSNAKPSNTKPSITKPSNIKAAEHCGYHVLNPSYAVSPAAACR